MNCPKCGLMNTGNMVVGLAMPQCMCHWQALPPQRQWIGLTEEDLENLKLLTFEKEINADGEEQEAVNLDQLIRAAEQLCKEKNK